MLGVQSIGLVVWTFFLVVFIAGCGMFIAGAVGFGVTTATHRKKRFRIIFAVIAVIGIVMIVIPALKFHYLRQANGADREDCIETEYNTQYHYEKIDGTWYWYFDYDNKKYINIGPESITDDEISAGAPAKQQTKENALLNIHEKIDFMDRVFNSYDQQTVFKVKSDFDDDVLGTETDVYCPDDQLDKAERYYEDYTNYDFFINDKEYYNPRKGTPVDIGKEMNKISKLDLSKTVKNPKGKDTEVDSISKDDLFDGVLWFRHNGDKAYLYIKEYDGDDEGDDFPELYVQIPDDIARTLIPKLKK